MATRTLEIIVAGDDAAAQRMFRRVDGGAKKMGDSVDRQGGRLRGFASITSKGFGRVGVAAGGMAAAGAAGAALLAKSFVEGASDINESLSKNRILFGRFADEVDRFTQTSAKNFGISRQAALEYTGTFGNLFRAMGSTRQESAKFSVRLTRMAADMASFNNASVEDTLEAIRSGLVGETEPLRRFGVNLSAASVQAQAVSSGLVKVAKSSTEYRAAAFKASEAVHVQAQALKEHGGQSAEYRKASLAVEKANKDFAATAKGSNVELTAQQKALAAVALISKQTTAAHGDFARTSGGLANQQRILKAQFADTSAELGGRLIPFALKAVHAVNSLFDSSTKGGRAIQGMGRWAARAGDWIKDAWATAAQAVSRFVQRNRADIQQVIQSVRTVGKFFREIFQDVIVPAVRAALPPIRTILGGIVTVIRGLVRIVSGIINGDWKRVWQGVKDIVKGAFDALKGVIALAAKALIPLMVSLAKKLIGALIRGLGSLASAVKDAILSGVKKGLNAAAGGIGDLVSKFNPLNLIGDGIGKKIGDGFGIPVRAGGAVNLMGADPDLLPFASIGARMGLGVSSGIRPGAITSSGNVSYHSSGDAIDMSGPPSGMLRFFATMKALFGSKLRELIYTPGGVGIKDGRPFRYSGQVANDHYDHVHLAYTGPFGDGIGQAAQAAKAAGWRGRDLVTAVAVAGPESHYRNAARLVTGAEDSRSMWQINVRAHPWAARLNLQNPFVAARAAYRVWREAGGSFRPWSGFTSGGYRSFVDDAQRALAGASSGGGGAGGGRAQGPLMQRFTGASGHPGKAGFVGTELERLEAGEALAELTPGTADDVGSARAMVSYWRKRLRRAKRSGRPAAITAAAQGLKAARDNLAGLLAPADNGDGSVAAPVDTGAGELAAQLKRMNDFNDWLINTQGPTLVGAVVAAVNGGIGGRVGLGFSGIRSPAGNVAGL